MILIRVEITNGPKYIRRQTPAIQKAALLAGAERWHDEFLPRHFEESAYGRYKIEARTAKYARRKRRLKGHNKPNVWSGQTEREATSKAYFGGTSKAVWVKFPGTNALNFSGGREELTRTTQREIRAMAAKIRKQAQHEIDTLRLERKRRTL